VIAPFWNHTQANGIDAAVNGGGGNKATGDSASVSGGLNNTAAASVSTVGGGLQETIAAGDDGGFDWRAAGMQFADN
jgi:hypothetical protein